MVEVKYDHLQGNRFRHAAVFQRFRSDKPPAACRYDQLEVTTPYELEKVFGASGVPPSAGPQLGVKSGSSASCAGLSASATCCKFTRMRVHVSPAPAHRIHQHVRCLQLRQPPQGVAPSSAPDASQRLVFLFPHARISSSGILDTRRVRPGVAAAREGITRFGSPGCF